MTLRMIEMVIPSAAAPNLAELSDESHALGVWREALDNDLALLRVLVHTENSDAVIRALEERFRGQPTFRLVIFEVAATLPRPESEDQKESKAPGEGEAVSEAEEKNPQRVAVEELVQHLSAGATIDQVFVVTAALATLVAAVGLIRDNVAVIIGAMVIAPLLTPNMTLSVATTLGDLKLAKAALRVNAVGLLLALALAVSIGLLVPFDSSVREITTRTQVSLSDIALALAAGSAGALAFTTGLSASLVGVMVAVALLPPLVATGLLLGAGRWEMALAALLLTATNVICVNLAGVGTFLWQGVRPHRWWQADRAARMVRIAGVIWIALLVVLTALIVIANHAIA